MPIENEPKLPTENLIGDMPFGLTRQAIEKQAAEMSGELDQINAELAKGEVPQALRKFCENRKAKIEVYLSTSTDEIFLLLQVVYDFVLAHEQQGNSRDDILRSMNHEKPELVEAVTNYYDVLRSQTWGYRVFQYLYALSLRR